MFRFQCKCSTRLRAFADWKMKTGLQSFLLHGSTQ
uniref:Uncharacterized protein n=1 Tax=Anguilla anguilla TaxID=7936 RepID=A0A0E9TMK4_ANGAN